MIENLLLEVEINININNLKLTTLIKDIFEDGAKGILSILKIRIFLNSLKVVCFTNETKSTQLIDKLEQWFDEIPLPKVVPGLYFSFCSGLSVFFSFF